ncbi:MAG: hypothetical protein ACREPJ_12070 [Rhodanobacteraceae bacterium]
MSYQRRLVEYALQAAPSPVTATALAERVVALAIDAGASVEVIEAITPRAVAAQLRALVGQARACVAAHTLDVARARKVPCWTRCLGADDVPAPKPPPGIPAVMRSTQAEKAMDALLRAFADDAASAMVRIQAEIKQLTDRYAERYQAIMRGND